MWRIDILGFNLTMSKVSTNCDHSDYRKAANLLLSTAQYMQHFRDEYRVFGYHNL